MSIRVMTNVWQHSQQKGSALLLLLALADHAADDGYCWPGRAVLAEKIRMSERSVTRIIQSIEADGELHVIRSNINNRYVVTVGMTQDDLIRTLTNRKQPIPEVTSCHVTPVSTRSDIDSTSEVTQPCQPNHQEPSKNHQNNTPDGDLAAELFPEREPAPVPSGGPSVMDNKDPLSMMAHVAKKRQEQGSAPDWAMVGPEGVHPFYPVVASFCSITRQGTDTIKAKQGKGWLTKYEKMARDHDLTPGEMLQAHEFLPGEEWGAWNIAHHKWSSPYNSSYEEMLVMAVSQIQSGTIQQANGWSKAI